MIREAMIAIHMQTKYYLYLHTFPNNKYYIGITHLNPKERWKKEGKGYKKQKVIWNAIQKYGWDNIKHEILYESTNKKEIEQKERYYITEVYHSNDRKYGYNIENGGNYYGKASFSTIEKRIKKLRGQKRSKEQRKRISEAHKGIPVTEEAKQKMHEIMSIRYIGKGNPMYGKKLTEEHKQKLYAAIIATRKCKRVRCIETGEIFESLQAAANFLGLFRKGSSNLLYALKKSSRTCKGYHWEYVEN